jgi:hypothetical protein
MTNLILTTKAKSKSRASPLRRSFGSRTTLLVLLAALVAVNSLVKADSAVGDFTILETLRGVDRADSLNFDGQAVSFGGGANLMIAARGGMYEDTSGNSIGFATSSLTGSEIVLAGTAQTQNDCFLSSPVFGRLHYTMPSATDLVPSATMEAFKALDQVELYT